MRKVYIAVQKMGSFAFVHLSIAKRILGTVIQGFRLVKPSNKSYSTRNLIFMPNIILIAKENKIYSCWNMS